MSDKKKDAKDQLKDILNLLEYMGLEVAPGSPETLPSVQYLQVPATVRIQSDSFAQGAMQQAFYGYFEKDSTLYVFKKHISKIPFKEALLSAKRYLINQAIASVIAEMFNRNVGAEYKLTLPVVKVFIGGDHIYTAERFLGDGEFVKYNSNTTFVNPADTAANRSAQAFSHFSYHVSKCHLLIVDLQGIGNHLTDVACHSTYAVGDSTDLGEPAMDVFFERHTCNDVCEQLRLPPAENNY